MVNDIATVIAFILGGLILLWGFRTAAFAFSGGERSGLHELAPPSIGGESEEAMAPSPEDVAAKKARHHRIYQALNYGLSLAALGALAALLIGAVLA